MASEAERLDVSVATPLGLALSGHVESVTAPSVDGELTVLPQHVPLLAALKAGLLKLRLGLNNDLAAVGPGFLEVDAGRVLVLTEQLVRPGDVDLGAAQEDLERAQRDLAGFGEQHEASPTKRSSARSTGRRRASTSSPKRRSSAGRRRARAVDAPMPASSRHRTRAIVGVTPDRWFRRRRIVVALAGTWPV